MYACTHVFTNHLQKLEEKSSNAVFHVNAKEKAAAKHSPSSCSKKNKQSNKLKQN
jgi:hypothetical protein